MVASRRDRPGSRLTPLRAVLFGVAWLVVGVLARARFSVRECRGSAGGLALALYVVVSLAILVWAKLRQGDVATEYERPYRRLGLFVALLMLLAILSACGAYLSAYGKCSD
jgi:hypothetical protein